MTQYIKQTQNGEIMTLEARFEYFTPELASQSYRNWVNSPLYETGFDPTSTRTITLDDKAIELAIAGRISEEELYTSFVRGIAERQGELAKWHETFEGAKNR